MIAKVPVIAGGSGFASAWLDQRRLRRDFLA
jgi:hypothetical protein